MRNEDWIQMFRLIPEAQHNQLVIALQNSTELVVDVLFRFEPNFLVMRGRQSGNTDEGRGFLVPYDQMLCLRLERKVKLQEFYELYGEEPPASAIEDRLGEKEEKPADKPAPAPEPAVRPAAGNVAATMLAGAPAPATSPTPTESNGAGRNNLLERIRAARATTAGGNRQNTQ